MGVRIGLNGFGRIGRYIARLLAGNEDLELVAVNARSDHESLAHLLKYDSVHGTFSGQVEANEQGFILQGKQVRVSSQPAGKWNWDELGIDILLESTGKFTDRKSCLQHLQCGAKRVLITAPGKDPDLTVVMGVNDHELSPGHKIISNASCTTNCLAPTAKVVQESFGLQRGVMTTVHSYTMNQRILDGSHKDLRRARAACMSMLPTSTGAARSVTEVIPELKGKLEGMSIRVPTPNVSIVDLTADIARPTSVKELNQAFQNACQGELKDILDYREEPLVSVDYLGSTYGGIVDALSTTVIDGTLIKLIVWYDNESGFSNQLLRLSRKVASML